MKQNWQENPHVKHKTYQQFDKRSPAAFQKRGPEAGAPFAPAKTKLTQHGKNIAFPGCPALSFPPFLHS